jgi:hypothetical protein
MTLDERLSEIEHRPTTWTIDDCKDLLALAREYRDELAEAVRLLQQAQPLVPGFRAIKTLLARHEGENHD